MVVCAEDCGRRGRLPAVTFLCRHSFEMFRKMADTNQVSQQVKRLSYEELEEENQKLRKKIAELEGREYVELKVEEPEPALLPLPALPPTTALSSSQISRYSRQLLVPYFGTEAQVIVTENVKICLTTFCDVFCKIYSSNYHRLQFWLSGLVVLGHLLHSTWLVPA